MVNAKKVIVCDLDGTLAPSKSKLSPEMAEVICSLLLKHILVVVSGGVFSQFEKQFLSQLHCGPEVLKNLYLFPTMGTTCFVYDSIGKEWKQLYNESLDAQERENITYALKEAVVQSGLDFNPKDIYGSLIEDRGSQITFSGRGQEAPIQIKESWDPDKSKRQKIAGYLKDKIPQFDISFGGMTSIDITRKGLDKAYAIGKIKKILEVTDDDIIFVGDALYAGGNDAPVKKTDVDYIQEDGPDQTIEFLRQYL